MCVCAYIYIYIYIQLVLYCLHLFLPSLWLSSFLHIKEGSLMENYKRTEEYVNASSQHHETAPIDKKYGGLVPKKKPLISKDHERAFFDSADWALCKQGAGAVAIETLQPKLKRTPHQQLPPRRPACTS
ncbi:hypothetical protein ACP275_07G008100 [Erythranthe tilingii]